CRKGARRRPGADRRGPHRRPDRVRQDRAGRGQGRPGRRRAVHRHRWRTRARGRGCALGGRGDRGRRQREADPARRGDRRGRDSDRTLRPAPCSARLGRSYPRRVTLAKPAARPPAPRKPAAKQKPKRRARRKPNPYVAWRKRLDRTRPGLVEFTLGELAGLYGHHAWERRWDPTSELILTILTQNSADVNAEQAFIELRKAYPSDLPVERHNPGPGWGGAALPDGAPPDWFAVDIAPLEELVEVIRPGGLPNQKAKGIKAALRSIHEARGDYSLEFLSEMSALEARAWLTSINGVGVKTASVVLLFSFGLPLMPVDRHVERVAQRVGLLPTKATADQAHAYSLALPAPAQLPDAPATLTRHGRLVCHSQRPNHMICPLRDRCRFFEPKAP